MHVGNFPEPLFDWYITVHRKKKHKNKKCTFTEIFLNSYIAMFVDKKEQFRKIQVNFHSAEMYAAKLKNTGKLKQNFQQYYSTEEL